MTQTPLTKEYLDSIIVDLKGTVATKKHIQGLREDMATKEDVRDIIKHFNKGQVLQNERMDKEFGEISEQFAEVNVKLDAIMKMLVMRQEMHNLVGQLREQGMTLDETKIFVT